MSFDKEVHLEKADSAASKGVFLRYERCTVSMGVHGFHGVCLVCAHGGLVTPT